MRRGHAIVGSALFLLVAPGTAVGLVPWWITRWRVQPPLLSFPPLRVVGALLIIASIPVLLDSFARFALKGLGTPAPIFPTRHLVVSGLYVIYETPSTLRSYRRSWAKACFSGTFASLSMGRSSG